MKFLNSILGFFETISKAIEAASLARTGNYDAAKKLIAE